jgi:hypothetical protein
MRQSQAEQASLLDSSHQVGRHAAQRLALGGAGAELRRQTSGDVEHIRRMDTGPIACWLDLGDVDPIRLRCIEGHDELTLP